MNYLALAFALFAADPAQNSDKADLKAVMDRLDRIEQSIITLGERGQQDVLRMRESIMKDINLVHERMDAMQKELDAVKQQPAPRTSFKPVEATTATVLLTNSRFDMPFHAFVNGALQTVQAGQSVSVSVPAGSVALELITTREAPKTRMLQAGATHVVTLR